MLRTIMIFLSFGAGLLAISNEMLWTELLGESSGEAGFGTQVDSEGNVYTTGYTFSDPFDGNGSAGPSDIFLAKYSRGGTLLWTRLLGSDDGDRARAMHIEGSSIYIAGDLNSSSLDDQNNSGGDDIILAKYDTDGNKLWTRLIGGDDREFSYAVTADSNGVYLCGFTESATFDGHSAAAMDAVLVKYDSSGTKLWSTLLGGSGNDFCFSIALHGSSLYMSGGTGSGTFDGHTTSGLDDAFIAKFDTGGNKLWTKVLGGGSYDYGTSVALDDHGDLYVGGYSDSSTFDGHNGAGEYDLFLAKYTAGGTKLWSALYGGNKNDTAGEIAVANGTVFMTGHTDSDPFEGQTGHGLNDAFAIAFDAQGTPLWSRLLGGTDEDYGSALVIDDGNLYITGRTKSFAFMGETGAGDYDIFLTRMLVLSYEDGRQSCNNIVVIPMF